jgi:hypothetical protein
MGNTMMPFPDRCKILAEFYGDYRGDDKYSNFFEANELGLPLSFAVYSKLVDTSTQAEKIISETWKEFCDLLNLDYDGVFDDLAQILSD